MHLPRMLRPRGARRFFRGLAGSLRARLAASFGVVLLLGAGVTVLSILALNEAALLDEKTRDQVMPMIVAIDNAESAHQRSAVLIRDIVEHKLGAASKSRETLLAEGARFDDSIASLWNFAADDGPMREGLTEVEARRAELKSVLQKIVAYVDDDQEDNARLAVVAELRPVQASLSGLLEQTRLAVLRESHATLTAAVEHGKSMRRSITSMTLGAVLTGLLAAFWMSRQITSRIDTAVSATERVAAGELGKELSVSAADELGRLLHALERMRGGLVEAVGSIRESAGEVEVASRGLARRNAELSTRTDEQAASLEETAGSMQQLTATVQQNAQSARQADGAGQHAVSVAERGGKAMDEAAQNMDAIARDSRTIGEIVRLIDGIAFQTNILALNAAVEAAHAGDRGRGFAVVASEVRGLAERSSEAARDIRALVESSGARVSRGVALVEQAGHTMAEIVDAVREVTAQLSRIKEASSEQLSGIRQVAHAVTQMEQATQQNAELVEQSALSAERMASQAVQLMAAVSRFHLPDTGSRAGALPERSEEVERVLRESRARARPGLQDLGRVVREPRPLAAHEGHVPGVRPSLEAIDHVGEAG